MQQRHQQENAPHDLAYLEEEVGEDHPGPRYSGDLHKTNLELGRRHFFIVLAGVDLSLLHGIAPCQVMSHQP